MYYLQSRYYDPEVCRFINADEASNLAANGDFISYNLYLYCCNNPVLRKDDGGQLWNTIIGAAVGGLIGGISSAIQGDSFWTGAAQGATAGAISGAAVDGALLIAASGGALAIAGGILIAAAGGMAGSLAGEQVKSYATDRTFKQIDKGMIIRAGFAGLINTLSFGLTASINYAVNGNVLPGKFLELSSNDAISTFTATQFAVEGELINAMVK